MWQRWQITLGHCGSLSQAWQGQLAGFASLWHLLAALNSWLDCRMCCCSVLLLTVLVALNCRGLLSCCSLAAQPCCRLYRRLPYWQGLALLLTSLPSLAADCITGCPNGRGWLCCSLRCPVLLLTVSLAALMAGAGSVAHFAAQSCC